MKKCLFYILLFLIMTTSTTSAGLVNAISIVVNGKPITLFDIYMTQKTLNVSKTKAIELLIEKRIKEAELDRLGISVDDYDVSLKIEQIAQQNGLDSLKMRSILAKEGVSWNEYKESIKEKILQERLYKRVLSTKIEAPSDATLKEYYSLHINEFSTPEKIDVIKYSSPDKSLLRAIISNPLASVSGVHQTQERINTKDINKELLFMLLSTPKGEFTQIIPASNKYIVLMVKDFINLKPTPFNEVKEKVYVKWMEQKQQDAIESHFDKLRATADIKVLRTP